MLTKEVKALSGVDVLILGGTGLLGQSLVSESKRRGVSACSLARSNADLNFDATNSDIFLTLLRSLKPKIIINAIANVNLDSCEKNYDAAYSVNSQIVSCLSAYCAAHKVKFCHISTDHYYTGDRDLLHREDAPIQLVNGYARTKYAGECFARENHNSLIVRTNIVGFRGWEGRPTFVEWFIKELEESRPISMFSDFYTSSIDVGSFSSIIFDLIESDASGVINVASRDCLSKADFIGKISQRLGFDLSNCTTTSVKLLKGVNRAESLGLDVSYCEKLLGYTLPTSDQVIEKLANQYGALR